MRNEITPLIKFEPGAILCEKYRILRLLGEGGIGVVFLAENIFTEEQVAVKIIKKTFRHEQLKNLLVFKKEADILHELDHKQIGRLYEFDFVDDRFFMVMEYMEGTNLQNRLEKKTPFELNLFLDIAIQLGDILSYIHRRNILHSDIKPSNILLQKQGKKTIVKILDFGIALLLPVKVNAFYQSINSCAYMSPEQSGFVKREIDHRSDLYSLGIVFYHMLTGELPYSGEDAYHLMHQHIASRPASIVQKNPEIPDVVEKIVFRLLNKDPEERYCDGRVLADDLRYVVKIIEKGETPIPFSLGQSPPPGNQQIPVPFTGREKELEILNKAFIDSGENIGSVYLISGESGIGKTRLIENFQEYVLKNNGIYISANNYEIGKKDPFNAISQAINRFLEILSLLPPEEKERLEKILKKRLGHSGDLLTKTIPQLKQFFPDSEEITKLSGQAEKQRFDTLLVETLIILSETVKSTVLFIDNIQWSDLGTLQFIDNFLSFEKQNNILLILSLRNPVDPGTEQSPFIKKIKENSSVTELTLQPHTREEIQSVFEAIIRYDEDRSREISDAVFEKTKGNIQFVKELLQYLNKRGFLEKGVRFEWEELDRANISDNRMAMIRKKTEDLPLQTKSILSHMAVMGRDILISRLFECFSNIEKMSFIQAISEGTKAGVIFIRGNHLIFTHASLQKFFYEEFSEKRLSEIHEQIAIFYEESVDSPIKNVGEEINPDSSIHDSSKLFSLAYHYSKSQNTEKAFEYLCLAAEESLNEKSFSDALSRFRKAETLLKKKGAKLKDTERVLLGIGTALSYLGKPKEAETYLYRAFHQSADNLKRSDILQLIANGLIEQGNYPEAVKVLKSAYKITGKSYPGHPILKVPTEFIKFRSTVKKIKKKETVKKKVDPVFLRRVQILERLDYIGFWTGDSPSMMYNHYKSLNISLKSGSSTQLLRLMCIHLAILTSAPLPAPLFSIVNKKISSFYPIAKKIHNSIDGIYPSKLLFRAVEAGILHFTNGDYINGLRIIREVMVSFKNERTMLFFQEITSIYSQILEASGEFDELLALGAYTSETAKMFDNSLLRAYGETYTGIGLLFKGEPEKAKELLERSCSFFLEKNDKVFYTIAGKYLIKSCYDSGDPTQGAESYFALKKYIGDNSLSHPAFSEYHGFFIAGECMIFLSSGYINPTKLKKVKKALLLFKAEKQKFKFLIPRYICCEMLFQFSLNNRNRGEKLFLRGENYFRQKKSDYNKGLFYYIYGLFVVDPRKQDEYLKKAFLLLHYSGANYIVNNIEKKLNENSVSGVISGEIKDHQNDISSDLKTTRELDLILDIGKKIGSIHDLQSLLTAILQQALELVGAERGEIILEGNDTVKSVSSFKINDLEEIPVCQSVIRSVRENRAPVIISNAGTDPVLRNDPTVIRYGLKSILCVPLIDSEKLLGVIYLSNHRLKDLFSAHELDLINALSGEAAVAITNALLLEQTIELQRRLSHIVNSISSGIIAVDREGRILEYNEIASELLHTESKNSDLKNHLFYEDFPLLKECILSFERIISLKSELEKREITVDDLFFKISITPLKSESVYGAVIKINDITDSIKNRDHLITVQKMETVSTMVGGLAHDFNNTLTGISASAGYLSEFVLNDENPDINEIKESLKIIEGAVKQASGMINRLLTFSMKKETEPVAVDMIPIIRHALDLTRRSLDQRIDFKINLPETQAVVMADSDQLEQVIFNILINAGHSMTLMREENETQGGTLSVDFSPLSPLPKNFSRDNTKDDISYRKLTIADTGIGMNRETVQKIFEPFFTTKRSGKGTGLGLAMVYGIIKQLKGEIEVESTVGEGTRFHIYIPAELETVLEEISHPEEEKPVLKKGLGATLLIAEDENILRTAITKSLSATGYTVYSVKNGQEAVDCYRENFKEIDLVVLDMIMPELTGDLAYEKMKEINPNIEVLLTSGFKKDIRVEKLLNSGVRYFMQKPYYKNDLLECIDKILNE